MNVNCCCSKGAADSMEDAEFPCFDCTRHPNSLMRDSRFRCKRHASQAAGAIRSYAPQGTTVKVGDVSYEIATGTVRIYDGNGWVSVPEDPVTDEMDAYDYETGEHGYLLKKLKRRANTYEHPERLALTLVAHAAATAKKLGGTTPENVCEVVSRSVRMNVPDPELAELIIAYVRELTISEESA